MPDDENVVYIGSKPPMSYVMAVMRTFNETNSESVVLKARGRAISSAVDVAEITRNRFLTDLGEPVIDISTEQLPSREGGTRGVSSISITLNKNEGVMESEEATGAPNISGIKGVGEVTEEKLINAGYKSVKAVAEADAEEIAEKADLSLKVAENIIQAAKEIK